MSRQSKSLLIAVLLVFTLACNLVARPIRDAQEVVGTAQSFASAMPLETIQAFATSMPLETMQSFATAMPLETIEALGNMFDPQGEPVSEWNGIPVMPEAITGQEFGSSMYSFKVDGALKDVQDFYDARMKDLGWDQPFNMPIEGGSGIMVFQKDGRSLTITITAYDASVVVLLTLG
jgi:hypothetical protein